MVHNEGVIKIQDYPVNINNTVTFLLQCNGMCTAIKTIYYMLLYILG